MKISTRHSRPIIEILLFFIVAYVLYMPLAKQFGYYNDDWYSMYAARVAGPEIFREIYSIDRPARALVMIPLYRLFGQNPFGYSLSAYIFRVLGTASLLWLLRLLWSKKKNATLLIALLFLIYPGFLSQPNAIDFQSHLVGILLAFLSLGLTVSGLKADKFQWKILFWLGSVLTGWGYLGQMEYYIGFEAVRLAIIVLLVSRERKSIAGLISSVFKAWSPYSLVPLTYLGWRVLLFDNQRPTTDVELQFGKLLSAPLETIYTWLLNFIQSLLNVLALAWGTPLSELYFNLDLHSSLVGLVLAIGFTAGILILFLLIFEKDPGEAGSEAWRSEAFWLGLAWVVFGLLPVIFANRSVVFPNYSRYGIVSAVGAAIILVFILNEIKTLNTRWLVLGFLLFSASLTHYGNSVNHASFSNGLRTFWWQVSWRIPQLEEGTTLIVNYPVGGVRETSFVWGPANHIYYPTLLEGKGIRPGIYALMLNENTVASVISRQKSYTDRYNVVGTYPNYRNILIISQPTVKSCVHVIDGNQPEYSGYEQEGIVAIGPYSETEHILLEDQFQTPPDFLFGSEPDRGWCYYYQKASLMRQRGEWDAVVQIGEQAFSRGFMPADPIEWVPFLQAYAQLGDLDRLQEKSIYIRDASYILWQACDIFRSLLNTSSDIQTFVSEDLCAQQ